MFGGHCEVPRRVYRPSHATASPQATPARVTAQDSASTMSRLGILESPSAEPRRLRLPVVARAPRRQGDLRRAKEVAQQTGKGGGFKDARPLPPGEGAANYSPARKESLAPPRLFLRNFHGDLSSWRVEGVEFPPQMDWAEAQSGGRGRPWEGLGKSSAGGSFNGEFLPGSDHCLLWPLSQVQAASSPARLWSLLQRENRASSFCLSTLATQR